MLDGLFDFIGGGVFAIFLVIIVVVLIVSYIGSRYKVAGANEALIVSGQRDKSARTAARTSRSSAAAASSSCRWSTRSASSS